MGFDGTRTYGGEAHGAHSSFSCSLATPPQLCHVSCLVKTKQRCLVSKEKAETYGALTRRKREEKEYGLREFAKMIGVSPTYLSKVERDELPPPAELRVVRTAELLELDKDVLLALAGRVSADLEGIIKSQPKEMASFLRQMRGMSPEEIVKAADRLKRQQSRQDK